MIFTPIKFTASDNGGLDFSSIFGSFNASANEFYKQLNQDVDALTNFKIAVKNGQEPASALSETMLQASQTAKNYAPNVIDDDNAIKKYATSQAAASKAIDTTRKSMVGAQIAAKALNFVLNTAFYAIATWGIAKIVEGISNWINRVEIQKQKVEKQESLNNVTVESIKPFSLSDEDKKSIINGIVAELKSNKTEPESSDTTDA